MDYAKCCFMKEILLKGYNWHGGKDYVPKESTVPPHLLLNSCDQIDYF